MRRYLKQIFLWSWILTVPISLVGGYLLYRAADRTYTYSVRYGGNKEELQFDRVARYEINQLTNLARVKFVKELSGQETSLKSIHLVVPEANLGKLEAHMPQSGFEYVGGRIIRDGKLSKVKVKYRGDTFYRWAWDKKSLRIKTSKKSLFEGIRSVNLLAPRSEEQLNNYLSYRLAKMMGVLAPRTELIRLFLNGEDRGVHTLVEQIKELTLRNASLMPGDIYRGELIGKDRFGPGAPTDSLFRSAAVWDKVAINNHYAESSKAPLDHLINLIQQSHLPEAQEKLSQIMDMEAWGRFSAFESLTQTMHTDEIHNWRIYFDPWRSRFVPIVWDPMGWIGTLRGASIGNNRIPNSLMKALYSNGD
ncbi:MAG: CotH kinase family protein, partial [Nitrospinaceae bacterium]|nr:CotH kinase family protein [Nitrospinaceae bacterium]